MTFRDPERSFWFCLQLLATCLAGLLVWILLSMILRVSIDDTLNVLKSESILASIKLSVLTSSLSTAIATFLSVPIGYLLARRSFAGKSAVEAVCSIPISAPPLVFGLGLLIFFQSAAGRFIETNLWAFTFQISGIVLCQSLISTAYFIQMMQAVFQAQPIRLEQISLTFGYRRWEAFAKVAIPQARQGILIAVFTTWAHCMGVFGPILVFAGMVRGRTEVLSTTIWLELQSGNLEAAIVASLLLISVSVVVTATARRIQSSRRDSDDSDRTA